MRSLAPAVAVGAIAVVLLTAFRPQQIGTDPWERIVIHPKQYRSTTLELQSDGGTQATGTIPLPPQLGSVFVATDIIVSDNVQSQGSFFHYTIEQTGGPKFVISRNAGHLRLTNGIVFNSRNPNPITFTAKSRSGSGFDIGVTLVGWTF